MILGAVAAAAVMLAVARESRSRQSGRWHSDQEPEAVEATAEATAVVPVGAAMATLAVAQVGVAVAAMVA